MKESDLIRLAQDTQLKLDQARNGEVISVALPDRKYIESFSDYFTDYEIVRQGEDSKTKEYIFYIKNRLEVVKNA